MCAEVLRVLGRRLLPCSPRAVSSWLSMGLSVGLLRCLRVVLTRSTDDRDARDASECVRDTSWGRGGGVRVFSDCEESDLCFETLLDLCRDRVGLPVVGRRLLAFYALLSLVCADRRVREVSPSLDLLEMAVEFVKETQDEDRREATKALRQFLDVANPQDEAFDLVLRLTNSLVESENGSDRAAGLCCLRALTDCEDDGCLIDELFPPWISRIVELVEDSDLIVRLAACLCLKEVPREHKNGVLAPLSRRLKDESPAVRDAACSSLCVVLNGISRSNLDIAHCAEVLVPTLREMLGLEQRDKELALLVAVRLLAARPVPSLCLSWDNIASEFAAATTALLDDQSQACKERCKSLLNSLSHVANWERGSRVQPSTDVVTLFGNFLETHRTTPHLFSHSFPWTNSKLSSAILLPMVRAIPSGDWSTLDFIRMVTTDPSERVIPFFDEITRRLIELFRTCDVDDWQVWREPHFVLCEILSHCCESEAKSLATTVFGGILSLEPSSRVLPLCKRTGLLALLADTMDPRWGLMCCEEDVEKAWNAMLSFFHFLICAKTAAATRMPDWDWAQSDWLRPNEIFRLLFKRLFQQRRAANFVVSLPRVMLAGLSTMLGCPPDRSSTGPRAALMTCRLLLEDGVALSAKQLRKICQFLPRSLILLEHPPFLCDFKYLSKFVLTCARRQPTAFRRVAGRAVSTMWALMDKQPIYTNHLLRALGRLHQAGSPVNLERWISHLPCHKAYEDDSHSHKKVHSVFLSLCESSSPRAGILKLGRTAHILTALLRQDSDILFQEDVQKASSIMSSLSSRRHSTDPHRH